MKELKKSRILRRNERETNSQSNGGTNKVVNEHELKRRGK
jgi:hypothetical protein